MPKLEWDQTGERFYETGVRNGVLYLLDSGEYKDGVVWNGLISISENPTGAEPNPLYADDIKYLNLISREDFEATIEAYTYPDEFAACDGSASLTEAISIGQQSRKTFGLCYRTLIGNDETDEYGYKLHIVYGAIASPSEKSYSTINDTPEAITFSWDITTTPVEVSGKKPTAYVVVDTTKMSEGDIATLESVLYGANGTNARLPLPDELAALVPDESVEPTAPTFDNASGKITIPTKTGVVYKHLGNVVETELIVPLNTTYVITAEAIAGYYIPIAATKTWSFKRTD